MPKGIPKNGVSGGRFKKGQTPWNKGKAGVYSAVTLEKMSEAHKKIGSPWNIGRKCFDETKGKIGRANSIALKGRKLSPEHIAKRTASRIGFRHSAEAKEKMSKAQMGAKHYRWNPDREAVKLNLRNDGGYKEWRRTVLVKFGYRCIACGEDDKREIQADHIYSWAKYHRLRYMIENGQALCRKCHKRKTAMEMRGIETVSIY